jgi:hypothetical protein
MKHAALALALLCACAKDFDALIPFPCGHSGDCPAPFVCADAQCVAAPSTPCTNLIAACSPPGFPGSPGRCTVIDTGVVPASGVASDEITRFCVRYHGNTVFVTGACALKPGPASGLGFPGADEDCGTGFVCYSSGWHGDSLGICTAYCGTGAGDCPSGKSCQSAFPATANNGLGSVGVCVNTCTPLGNDCDPRLTCALGVDAIAAQPTRLGYCTYPGLRTEGQDCDPVAERWREQCAAGLSCWPAGAGATCSRICHSASDCASGRKCCGPDACANTINFPAGIGVCGT